MSKLTSGTLTLRLPGPPLPPKPLHLTTTKRAESRSYPQMPSWSRPNSIVQPAEDVVISSEEDVDEEEEEEEEIWWGASRELRIGEGKSQLYGMENTPILSRESHYDRNGREGSENGRRRSGIAESSSGSTLKKPVVRGANQASAARKSIFFDPTLPNPLVNRNSTLVDKQTRIDESLRFSTSKPSDPSIEDSEDEEDVDDQLDVTKSLLAVSLHSFAGETDFGELSFDGGTELRIEVEDLGGGWSLGYIVAHGEEGRGLIPRGFYAYVEGEETPVDTQTPSDSPSTSNLLPAESPSPSLDSPFPSESTSAPPQTPSIDTATTSSILNRSRGRSIGASVVISGVEFEPIDSPTINYPAVPSWLLPRPSSVEIISQQPPIATPSPTKEEIKIFFDGFANLNEVREVERIVEEKDEELMGLDAESVPVLAKIEEAIERQDSVTELANGVSVAGEAQVHDDLAGDMKAVIVAEEVEESATKEDRKVEETEGEDQFDTFAPSSFAMQPRPVSPSPSVLSLRNSQPRAAVTPSTLSRSFSGLYRLGLGTLGRSYSLTGIGTPEKEVESPRAEGGVKRLIEDWIMHGDESTKEEGETKYHIEEGPAWKESDSILIIQIHSPEGRPSIADISAHTSYQISTTVYPTQEANEAIATINVDRRYSHFSLLYSLLISRYPIISIDNLPSNAYAGRFRPEFIEARRRDLQRWLRVIIRHPVLSRSEELKGFLGMEEESDLKNLLLPSSKNASLPLSTDFFSSVYHPEFNVDIADAIYTGERFESHSRDLEEGKGFRDIEVGVQGVREGFRNLASTSKDLAHSIVRLVAGLAVPPSSTSIDTPSLTWKANCEDALGITKAVQDTAEAVAEISDLYEDCARNDLLSLQESIRDLSYPHSKHANLIELHKIIVAKNHELSTTDDEEASDRCDTLLNLSLAEMDRIHDEQLQDLRRAGEDYLDSQIRLHESALNRLKFARSHFEESTLRELAQSGPRLASKLERPPAPTKPLVHPSSYGLPRSAVASLSDPVNSAREVISESVGSLLRRRENQVSLAQIERAERLEPVASMGTGFFGTRRMW